MLYTEAQTTNRTDVEMSRTIQINNANIEQHIQIGINHGNGRLTK